MASRLRSLFGRRKEEPVAEAPEDTTISCPHTALIPRWDNPEDMGKEDRASRFYCEACGQTFSPEETQALRATEAERLKHDLGAPSDS